MCLKPDDYSTFRSSENFVTRGPLPLAASRGVPATEDEQEVGEHSGWRLPGCVLSFKGFDVLRLVHVRAERRILALESANGHRQNLADAAF